MGGLCAVLADPVTVPYWAGSILPTLYLDAPTNMTEKHVWIELATLARTDLP